MPAIVFWGCMLVALGVGFGGGALFFRSYLRRRMRPALERHGRAHPGLAVLYGSPEHHHHVERDGKCRCGFRWPGGLA